MTIIAENEKNRLITRAALLVSPPLPASLISNVLRAGIATIQQGRAIPARAGGVL